MNTDPHGFVHEAVIYDTDTALLDTVVPFLRAGITAGEPTLLAVDDRHERLILNALQHVDGLTVLAAAQYCSPFVALHDNWQLLRRHSAAGAQRIRIVGQVLRPGVLEDWAGWLRYEASINDLYAALPVWGICPYDRRTTAPDILADVTRTHPYLTGFDGDHCANPAYVDPYDVLAGLAQAQLAPLQQQTADVEVTDPSLEDARLAVATVALHTDLDDETVSGLIFATNEVVTNAVVHGRPPIRVQVWRTADRITVAVHDRGDGPADRYAGLLPDRHTNRDGASGLELAYRLCHGVTVTTTPGGCTVVLTARTP
jgi:anti-sigma regulatory factor (Ser/Thr protein kinase)